MTIHPCTLMKMGGPPPTPKRLPEPELLTMIGRVIRQRRKEFRWGLHQLSVKSGVSLGYVSQIELGKSAASIGTLHAICGALGLTLASLFRVVEFDPTPF